MKSNEVDLKPLNDQIQQRRLMEYWADGLFVETEEEGRERAEEKAEEAKAAYTRMMQSPKNDNSDKYRDWALGKALRINLSGTKTGYRTQASNRRSNRGLG